MTQKEQMLKPRLLESIDRLRKMVDIDVPGVIIGAEAWNVFQTVLATYGVIAASTMVQSIRDKTLQMRAICAHEDCTNFVDRPPLGLCKTCLATLDLPEDAEEITPDGGARNAVHAFLTELGWKAGGFGRRQETITLTDPHGDYQITWDGDIWRLARFDDSDGQNGIATARWRNIDEGETLDDLKPCLRSIGYGIAQGGA